MTKDEITFTTGSFSTYIIITVGTNQVTFSGENFRVLDTNGNEITDGASVASGTDFCFNIVPNNNYGITDVSCSTADVMSGYGDIKGKACYISTVSENMTITVTTAIAPSITTQPVLAKVKQGGSAKFSVVASDATTYEWQYRENKNKLWKSVTSAMGSNYTSATFTLSSTGFDTSGYEFRCLVGNDNFTAHERVKSDIATVSICQEDLVVGEAPIIMVQPNMDNSKVKVNSGKATYSITAMGGDDMTFTWQYRENKDAIWKSVTSSVASTSISTPSDSTTEKPLKKSTLTTVSATYQLSGYEFRCLVGNSFYANHDAVKSDIVTISVADDDIVSQSQVISLNITAQPESQKVKLGDKATFSVTAVDAGSYKWQYLTSGEELWKDVTSSMSSTYNKASMTIDTSSMSKEDSLSGALFRCIVSSASVSEYTKTSDTAVLSIGQGILEKDVSFTQVIQPEDATVVEGNDVSFTTGLDQSVSVLGYEWHEVSGDNDINLATLGTIYMSNNKGRANSTSSEKIIIKASGKATLSFDYMVSSEANDKFTVSIEDANGTTKAVDGISGIKNWATYSGEFTPNANGEIVLNLSYVKNGTIDGGEDYGAIKNLSCTSEKSIDKTCTYVTDDTFKMKTPDSEAYDTRYTQTTHTWVTDTTDSSIFKSNNKGVANSQATASVEINLPSVATLSFDYRVSSEGGSYDWMNISVIDGNGKTEVSKKLGGTTTAVTNWQTYTASVTPDSNGKVKILLLYRKDSSANNGDDIGAIRNIKVNGESIVTNNCTFASDDVFTLENNYKAISYIGADTNTLTIPASLVTLAKNGYKYYCDIEGIVTTKATLNVTEDEKPKMITEWTIPSGETEIKLPVSGTGLNIIVDWGDGVVETISGDITAENFPTHTYSTSGEYDISIRGICPKLGYNGSSEITETSPYYTMTQYITGLKQWGELSATNYGFSQCVNLKYVSGDATENTFARVDNMSNMFRGCTSLEGVDLSDFNLNRVGSMWGLFNGCASLENVDFSNINTNSLNTMGYMFHGCNSLTNLDLSYFNTKNFKDMSNMFRLCSSLTTLNLNNFDTNNVETMFNMFEGCIKIETLDLSSFRTSSLKTTMSMFKNCNALINLDISGFDTSNVTTMGGMFNGCSSIISLDLSHFNTSKVTAMGNMFANCSKLKEVNVSSFDTSNVTSMDYMFAYCKSLTDLEITNFDTSNVTTMGYMFNSCSSLTTLNLSSFDTSKVTNMAFMFYCVSGVETADLSGFNTNNVTDMHGMIEKCLNLKSLLISDKFIVCEGNGNMFGGTTKLSAIITTSSTPVPNQFKGDIPSTATLYVPNGSEEAYAQVLSGDTNASQIAPILQRIGNENINVLKDSEYQDAGYTVAGFTSENAEYYTIYGYNVEVSGDVDTSALGEYEITYTLNRTNASGDVIEDSITIVRTVVVVDSPIAMLYEEEKTYNDEWTANDITAVITLVAPNSSYIEVKLGSGEWSENPSYTEIKTSGDKFTLVFTETMNETLYVREIDVAGNATTNETKGNIIKIDKEAPIIEELVSKTIEQKVNLKARINDGEGSGIANFAVTRKNQKPEVWQEYEGTSGEIQYELQSAGTYYLWIKDRVGNVASSNVLNAVKDIKPPVGSIEIEPTNEYSGDKYTNEEIVFIKINVTDNESKQEEIQFALYNEADYAAVKAGTKEIEWRDYVPTVTWQLKETDGTNIIYAIFKDVAGNITMH